MVASNRIGTEVFEQSEITFYGGSFIAGPTGEIVAQVCACVCKGLAGQGGAGKGSRKWVGLHAKAGPLPPAALCMSLLCCPQPPAAWLEACARGPAAPAGWGARATGQRGHRPQPRQSGGGRHRHLRPGRDPGQPRGVRIQGRQSRENEGINRGGGRGKQRACCASLPVCCPEAAVGWRPECGAVTLCCDAQTSACRWGLFRDRRPDLYGPLQTLDGASNRRS